MSIKMSSVVIKRTLGLLAIGLGLHFDGETLAQKPAAEIYELERVPAAYAEQVKTMLAAMDQLQRELQHKLKLELSRKGPAQAVPICRTEVPTLTARVNQANNLRLGRTSHRVRNPNNRPQAWARAIVEAGAGKKAAEVSAQVLVTGDRLAVLRPIVTGALCLVCHGTKEQIPPEVAKILNQHYPKDRATDFFEGALRGYFWAEQRLAKRN